jgi:hypothetical protein
MNRLQTVAIAAAVFAGVATTTAQDNLRDRARASGGTTEMRISTEFGFVSIDDLVAKAAVIVHGRIRDIRPHLNATETMVVTDYAVTPHRFLKYDRSIAVSDTPGRMPELIVRRGGGTIVEGTTRISVFVDAYSEDDTPLGSDVVMFLGYDKDEKVFYFVDGPFGIFRVRDGHMEAVNAQIGKRRGDTPASVDAFLAHVAGKAGAIR